MLGKAFEARGKEVGNHGCDRWDGFVHIHFYLEVSLARIPPQNIYPHRDDDDRYYWCDVMTVRWWVIDGWGERESVCVFELLSWVDEMGDDDDLLLPAARLYSPIAVCVIQPMRCPRTILTTTAF